MEPLQPTFNQEYTTPVRSTKMVDPQQNLVCSIWGTPSVQDLYEKFNFNQPLLDPPHTSTTISANSGPSVHPIDHSVNQIINLDTTSGQVKSET